MDFRFYHCDAAGGGGELENTANIAELDSALINEQKKFMSPFCTSSALIRGCVRISAKNNQL
jgi:hypothetical protein